MKDLWEGPSRRVPECFAGNPRGNAPLETGCANEPLILFGRNGIGQLRGHDAGIQTAVEGEALATILARNRCRRSRRDAHRFCAVKSD